jgi:hypothetical protein
MKQRFTKSTCGDSLISNTHVFEENVVDSRHWDVFTASITTQNRCHGLAERVTLFRFQVLSSNIAPMICNASYLLANDPILQELFSDLSIPSRFLSNRNCCFHMIQTLTR